MANTYTQIRKNNRTFGQIKDSKGKVIAIFTKTELVEAGRRAKKLNN